jgi:membrane protein DedA with SNARE-associated domain
MDIATLIGAYGYRALALFCFLEGETVLVLAGIAAQRGELELRWVIAIAALAGWCGDQCFFWVGRRAGSRALGRLPALARQAQRVQRMIERHHAWVIVLVRFAYGLRIAGPLLIGTTRIPARRFALFNALGALLWAPSVACAGWAFGAAAERLLGSVRNAELWLFGGLLALAAALALVRALRGRRLD